MLKPCLDCGELTEGSRCRRHEKENLERRRADPDLTGRRATTPEWRRLRRAVNRRFHFACAECGSRGTALAPVEVHHIDGNARNNVFENLITLCQECHRKAQAALRAERAARRASRRGSRGL